MTRLAFVVNNIDFLLSHRLVLVKGAMAKGYEVHVIGPRGPGVSVLEQLGLTFHEWRLDRSGQRAALEALTIAQLVRIYRRVRPQLVHHVTIKPVLYGSFAARATGVGGVVNAVSGLGYIFLAEGPRAEVRRQAVGLAYRAALSTPNSRVIFQNDDDEAELRALGALAGAHIVKIRGSGVDLTRFRPQSEPDGGPVTVVLPARLLRDKGVVEFVEAGRLLKKEGVAVRMVLVGGVDPGNPAGITRAELDAWVGAGEVEWWGHRTDMPEVFAQANVVCLPSYREGMPKALLEAAACGKAIVTTDVPGCRDAVAGGHIGVLAPARDSAGLAWALKVLVKDPERRRILGSLAAAHARDNFSEDKVLQQHLEVYRALVPVR